MKKGNLGAVFRKLGIILLIVLLVLFFLFLYYFKYIPDNRERLQHRGFLILRQNEEGIQQSEADMSRYFLTQQQLFDENAIKQPGQPDTSYESPFPYSLSVRKKGKDSTRRNNRKTGTVEKPDACNPSIGVHPDEKNFIEFQFERRSGTWTYSVTPDVFFEKILGQNKRGFFNEYLVICQQHAEKKDKDPVEGQKEHAHFLYHSARLPVAEQINQDSIGRALTPIQFSKITSLEINGNPYKAFLFPFQFQDHTFVLAGLMRGSDYNDQLQTIPFGTISGLVIALLLIGLSLPYFKIFLISPEERFCVNDIIFLGATLFIGSALFLVIVQHTFMQTGARVRTKEELGRLSDAINKDFQKEIGRACNELRFLDSALRCQAEMLKSGQIKDAVLRPDKIFVISDSQNDTTRGYYLPVTGNYLNYTAVQWVNDRGKQVFIGRLDTLRSRFKDVGFRPYFQNIKDDRLYSFNDGRQPQRFVFEPVYSMATSEFETMVATLSRVEQAKMVGLSTIMYSLVRPVLPEGYGFFLIDKEGLILFQSEGQVTLKENFLEWIIDSKWLEQTIRNKESRFIPDQNIVNEKYSLFVRPLDDLPFYLLTYHRNEYTMASILRVTAFCLFSLLALFLLIGLLSFVAWRKANYSSRLDQSVFQYCWLRPGSKRSSFLKASILYLVLNIPLTLGFAFICCNSSAWFVGFISPVIVLSTIFFLFWQTDDLRFWLKDQQAAAPNKSWYDHVAFRKFIDFIFDKLFLIPLIILLLFNRIYWLIEPDSSSRIYLLLFQSLSILLAVTCLSIVSRSMKEPNKNPASSEAASSPEEIRSSPSYKAKMVASFMDAFRRWINPDAKTNPDKTSGQETNRISQAYYWFWFLCVVNLSLLPAHLFFQYAHEREACLLTKSQQLYLAEQTVQRLTTFDWMYGTLKGSRTLTELQKDSVFFMQGFYGLDQYFPFPTTGSNFSTKVQPFLYDSVIRQIGWNYRHLDEGLPVQNHSADHMWDWSGPAGESSSEACLTYHIPSEIRLPYAGGVRKDLEIGSPVPGFWNFNCINTGMKKFTLGALSVLLLIGFFQLIKLVADRAFLVQYFKQQRAKNEGSPISKQLRLVGYHVLEEMKKLIGSYSKVNKDDKYEFLKEIWTNEYGPRDKLGYNVSDDAAYNKPVDKIEDIILMNQRYLSGFYEQLWKSCNEKEKYFLFDMAEDGFLNCKNAPMVQQLLDMELIDNPEPGNLRIRSVSFRNYILSKKGSEEIAKLKEKYRVHGAWNKIQVPVQIAIAVVGMFLFITQKDIITRILASIPSINSLIGLSSTLFGPRVPVSSSR